VGILPGLLGRLERRLEEQEIAAEVDQIIARVEADGTPCDAEARADAEAYVRHRRTWPPDLSFDEHIQRAAAWWVPRIGCSVEEYVAEMKQLAAELTAESPDET
jgi:hypothetical protein